MEKRVFGKTGMTISIVTFGGIVVKGMEAAEAAHIVSEAVDRDINYFDVAPSYGNAQYVLGPALEPHRRNVYLACKTGKRTAAEAQAELEESLRALKTDYFDNYQLHGLDNPQEIETVFAPGGAMEVLVRAKEKGLTRNIGFTCHQDRSALSILSHFDQFNTMLFPVNFAYHLQKNGSADAVAACRAREMGIVAIKSLALRKWLEGEERTYPNCWYRPIYDDPALARLALNHTLNQGVTTAVPPGDQRMLRLALEIIEEQGGKPRDLSAEEKATLNRRAQEVKEVIF